jgi:hypothetical protein
MAGRELEADSSGSSFPNQPNGAWELAGTTIFVVLLVYAAARSVIAAASKAFWFDEMCTWVVAHQSSVAMVWGDTGRAIEPNPPPFYVVEHVFGGMLRNEQIAYRLPSILGFACILLCIFFFVRKSAGAMVGAAGAAVLLVTIAFDRYAIDARPYALETACIACAMVCYQRAPARRWTIALGVSLLFAASFHYYAVFALVPFALAEAALSLKTRTLRLGVWVALACGLVPLAVFRPLLARLRAYFGPHFWAKPTLRSATDTYGWLLEASLPGRATIAFLLLIAVIAGAVILVARRSLRSRLLSSSHFHEYVLCLGFLGLPLVMLVGARATSGGMTARYALPTLLGVPVAIACVAMPFKRAGAFAVILLALLAVGDHERQFWAGRSGPFGEFVSPAKPLEEMLGRAGHGELPVVVSNGLEYLSIVHYAPTEEASRFFALVDPVASVAEVGNDSLDKGLLAIQCCTAIRISDYSTFVAQHPVFLLYSDGDIDFDRWPRRLMRRRLGLSILATEDSRSLYLVDSNKPVD